MTMINILKRIASIFLILLCSNSFAQNQIRQIAVTIDDLPFVGESKNFHLNMIIEALKNNEVPATGFVIAGNVTHDVLPTLRKFREAGLGLGNHTFTHINLNRVNTESYLQEIEDADKTLAPVLSEPKYFRYPYLAMSKGNKKDMVLSFLSAKNYQVAPVTIDSKDFIFNQLLMSVPEKDRRAFMTVLKPCYLDFIWEQTRQAEEQHRTARKGSDAQVLLIHANLLNAYALPDIINLYKQNGYSFVSLDDALKPTSSPKPQKLAYKSKNKINDSIDRFLAWD
jgi:peptidoglycan/xylan/chitin deacetylase (PgdA/CDA1 family)